MRSEERKNFDVIVGNPPYQSKSENSDSNLYVSIFNKLLSVLKPNGDLLFVTPTSWLGKNTSSKKVDYSNFNNKQIKYIKILSSEDVKNYFNVGSKICWYHMVNTPKVDETGFRCYTHDVVRRTWYARKAEIQD